MITIREGSSPREDQHWTITRQHVSLRNMATNYSPSSSSPSSASSSLTIDEESNPLTLSWRGVNVYAKPAAGGSGQRRRTGASTHSSELRILKNVTGVCRPGELLAIMGASGAGKTTLLNVLTYRNNHKLRITGDLFVNGRRVDPDTLTSRSAYVQQDDLFIGLITVREQLIFQAALRMDRHLTHGERLARVDQVIMDLGLSGCEHTRIGTQGLDRKLSGGEIRRLNFACEVLTNPALLFCDEPTSGLDSFLAQNVVSMMKGMAEKGKTVLSTIHQPSSEVYAMFDRVLLMAEGRVAFLGNPDEALLFFSKLGVACPAQYNPADYFINQLSVEPGRRAACLVHIASVCDAFEVSREGEAVIDDVLANEGASLQQLDSNSLHSGPAEGVASRSPYKSSWTTQFQWVLWRSWLETRREPQIIRVRFLQILAMAVLLGFMYRQDGPLLNVASVNGGLFVLLCNMTFQNATMVINSFCSQKELFLREHHNGMYRADVYFLAKNLVDGPFFTFYAVLYTSIYYFLVGFSADVDRYLICVLTAVLVTWCALSFGYFLSCVSPSVNVALLLLAPFLLVFMLLGGYLLNVRSVSPVMKAVQYLSWFSYGHEVLMVNQWAGVVNITCAAASKCYPDGEAILQQLNFSATGVGPDFACLCGLILGYRSLAFLCFHLRAARSKPRR